MKLEKGTPVLVQGVVVPGVTLQFWAGLIGDMNDWGISVDSMRDDELPTGAFIPWGNVNSIHAFEELEDVAKFWSKGVGTG